MNEQDGKTEQAARLRRRAEAMARGEASPLQEGLGSLPPEAIQKTIHELRVNQIELEMQNEELRQAQAEVDAARIRYFDLYDLAPVGYLTLSPTGLIRETNFTAVTLLGVTRGELLSQPITRFIFKEDQDIYYRLGKQVVATDHSHACELRMVKKDGTVFWAHLAATAAPDPDASADEGGPAAPASRVVLSDITERKRVEAETTKLHTQLARPPKHHPSKITAKQGKKGTEAPALEGQPARAPQNETFNTARLRWRAEEIAKQKGRFLQEGPEDPLVRDPQKTLHELRVYQIELEMQNEELRRAQEELNLAKARYFDLYDLAPVGYCIISAEGLILEANLTAVVLLGLARAALVKQPITRFIHKDDQDIYYLHRRKFFETGEPDACELRMVKKDGTSFWARLTATASQDPLVTPGQNTAGLLVSRLVLSDITEQKRVEEEKAKLEAQLQQIENKAGRGKRGKSE